MSAMTQCTLCEWCVPVTIYVYMCVCVCVFLVLMTEVTVEMQAADRLALKRFQTLMLVLV